MKSNSDQTASFMVRLSQKIFEDEKGIPQVQWRGRISHVQGGDQKTFIEFTEAIDFIQDKLSAITKKATSDKTPEEQEGILSRSLDMWKKISSTSAKMAIETIKDPRKGVAQIQEQISQVGEDLGNRLEIDEWRGASKSDLKNLSQEMKRLSGEISLLHKKIDSLSDSK